MKHGDQLMDESTALQFCMERDRLLGDPEFSRSPSMCKLLRFLVDYKLSGNTVPLKSYTIATDALGRDASFDPQTDSYPRVQMGRLRRMLDNFYLRKGGEYRLAIAPKHYDIVLTANTRDSTPAGRVMGQPADVPVQSGTPREANDGYPLERPDDDDKMAKPDWRTILAVSVPILLTVIGVLSYMLWPVPASSQISYPKIALDLPDDSSGSLASRLAEPVGNRLVRGLSGFGWIRIFDFDSAEMRRSGYVVRVRFLEADSDRMELRLLDNISGEILWSTDIEIDDDGEWQLEFDQAIVAVAGHYGKIAQAEMSKAKNDYSAGYPCLMQFDLYIRYRDPEQGRPVRKCLKESVERFPHDSHLLSILAFARNMAENTSDYSGPKGLGTQLAWQAQALDPDNAAASFAIAQSAFFAGDCDMGVAWGKKALELNPLNSRIGGYLGLYMIGCNLPEGEEFAVRALELDPNADLTIAAAVAFQMLKRGEAAAARQLSTEYMVLSPRSEPALELTYIMSSAMLNDEAEARKAWKALAESYGLAESSAPREVLSRWIASPLLLDDTVAILNRSGIFRD
ncbi:tetratricopeptide repeat protein [Parasphingorhabdus sp.]|uniref:tetratricopeptide repeat protein n=1 Tax=Parasphingorhabdus sp. TaxID=2709688 RepID=UPI0030031A98